MSDKRVIPGKLKNAIKYIIDYCNSFIHCDDCFFYNCDECSINFPCKWDFEKGEL